jgi:hypothetical protein
VGRSPAGPGHPSSPPATLGRLAGRGQRAGRQGRGGMVHSLLFHTTKIRLWEINRKIECNLILKKHTKTVDVKYMMKSPKSLSLITVTVGLTTF